MKASNFFYFIEPRKKLETNLMKKGAHLMIKFCNRDDMIISSGNGKKQKNEMWKKITSETNAALNTEAVRK